MKKVCVIGSFGFNKNLLNGQTIKTKIIAKELSSSLGEDQVLKIDTHGGKKTLLKAPFQVIKALKNASNIIIMPAHNGVRVYTPLLSIFRAFFRRKKLHYVVIGGWLPNFIKGKKLLRKQLKKFHGIYVQTNSMKKALEEQGFKNVIVMPNFKQLTPLSESDLVYPLKEPYKLCTFSRVMKEKGIEDAVNAVKMVNEHFGKIVYELDIYGQVDLNQTKWFDNLKQSFPPYIRYCGFIHFDKSVEVLKNYFALLFPTFYDGEGFAGTLIDAMAAGVPVIASDWRYNSEIVIEGETGLLYPTKSNDRLVEKLILIYENLEQWNNLKINCIKKAYQYQPKTVIEILLQRLV
jgi:glycosyltransferase involved in cell wall biosynthesis